MSDVDFKPEKQVYGFAFGKGNVSTYTLWRLKNIDCCYQLFGETSIDHYIDHFLLHDQPGYILGIGIYSGIDQDKIRIEAKCTNQFRNDFMEGNYLKELDIKPFLKPNQSAKLACSIGNSYCNMASWKIMSKINKGELKSKYTFLHVPKYFKTWQAVVEIDEMLSKFKVKLH